METPGPSSASESTVQATLLDNTASIQQTCAFTKSPAEVRALAKKIPTTPMRRNRKKTESGYLNSTPSLKRKKPVDYSSTSDEDEPMVAGIVDDSSADEVDEQPPEEFAEVNKDLCNPCRAILTNIYCSSLHKSSYVVISRHRFDYCAGLLSICSIRSL